MLVFCCRAGVILSCWCCVIVLVLFSRAGVVLSWWCFFVLLLYRRARGTVYRRTVEILKCFGVEKSDLNYIAENIIADSVGIIHHHIYNN